MSGVVGQGEPRGPGPLDPEALPLAVDVAQAQVDVGAHPLQRLQAERTPQVLGVGARGGQPEPEPVGQPGVTRGVPEIREGVGEPPWCPPVVTYPCMGPAWPLLLRLSRRLRKGPPKRGSWALASAVLKWYSVTLSRRSWGIPPPRSEILGGGHADRGDLSGEA